MKKNCFYLLAFTLLLLPSCSQQKIMTTFFFKVPKLEIRKTNEFKALNPMQQDVALLVSLIKDAYPMWEQKISPTELAAERQRLMQLFETETDPSVMEVETQRLLAKLRDVHTNAHLFSLKSPRYFPLYYLQSHDSLFIANIGQVEKSR